jgi:hypothetical protein
MRSSIDRSTAGPAPAKRAAAFAVAAVACGLLTACGAASADTGTPAPVPPTSAAPGSPVGTAKPADPAHTAATGRPQLNLNSSEAEVRKYRLAYAACLKDHGMPSKGTWTKEAESAARAACESKRPLLPPELDPKKNPHYAQSVRIEARCLQDHGFDVRLVPPTGSDPNTISWHYESVPGPDVDIEKIQNDCRVKAFGGGRAIGPAPE